MPAILILRGPSNKTFPAKVGDFYWSEKHQEYIWQGRELSDEEFNRVAADVIERNTGRWPRPIIPRILSGAENQEHKAPAPQSLKPTLMKILLLILASTLCLTVGLQAQTVLTPASSITFAPGASVGSQQVKHFTLTPAQAETINGNGQGVVPGSSVRLIITSSGTTTYAITFGTNFNGKGTLQTGTTSGVVWVLDFLWDGTVFQELSRVRQNNATVTVPVTATTSTLPYSEGVVLYNFTPTSSENLAIDTVGRAGAIIYLHIIANGSNQYTTTFTTNIKPNGTLATGSSGATDSFATFISDGTSWREVASATGQTT